MSLSLSSSAFNWSSIITENKNDLLWACQKILNCPKRAEDVLQDAFIRLSQLDLTRTLAIKKPLGYLFQVVKNISIDYKRRLNRESDFIIELAPHVEVEDGASGPEQALYDQKLLNSIQVSLDKLPQRTREVFNLYRHGDLNQKSIAAKFNISPTLVNFLIKDAVTFCRDDLQ